MGEVLSFPQEETLYPVESGNLRATWGRIRDRVSRIAEKCEEDWIAEDVFHEILVGNAFLWAVPDCSGFAVLRLFATGYSRDLHIWVAHKDRVETCDYYMPQFIEIARTNGCRRVTWESPRPWDKILPDAKRAFTFAIEVGG